jgi:hypothetical protein
MAVTAINSAIFWDMTKCNVIEIPTFRGNVVPPSSRVNNPEYGSVSMCLTKCTLNHHTGRWCYSDPSKVTVDLYNPKPNTPYCATEHPYTKLVQNPFSRFE